MLFIINKLYFKLRFFYIFRLFWIGFMINYCIYFMIYYYGSISICFCVVFFSNMYDLVK